MKIRISMLAALLLAAAMCVPAWPQTIGGQVIGSIVPISASGVIDADEETVAVSVGGYGAIALQITGTWSATMEFEATVDGSTWSSFDVWPASGTSPVTSSTANGIWSAQVGGVNQLRVRASTFTSGSANITLRATATSAKRTPGIWGMTSGSVLFAGSSGQPAQDNASFFWDDADNQLGLGTNNPSLNSGLDVQRTVSATTTTANLNSDFFSTNTAGTRTTGIAGRFKSVHSGSGGTVTTLNGVNAEVAVSNGTVTNASGGYNYAEVSNGTVGTLAGFVSQLVISGGSTTTTISTNIATPAKSAGTVTDNYGLFIDNQAGIGGSGNWAIKTGTGSVDFGSATNLIPPTSAGAAPTSNGHLAYDSTANDLEYGDNGTNRKVANLDEAQTLTSKTLTTPVVGAYTVAGLPAAGTANRVAIVTDAATAGSCTSGGGSARSWCRDTGSAWEPLGDGGGGGGMTSFNIDGDNNSPQTITDGQEALFVGGVGVDTTAAATDQVTFDLDLAELVNNQTLWNSANASRTLTAGLSGAIDPVLTFSNNKIASANLMEFAGSEYLTGAGTSVLTGSIDPTASTAVVGVGTAFTTELQVGDKITVTGETRMVVAITDNTNLTVDAAFTDVANDASVDRLPAIFLGKISSGTTRFIMDDQGAIKVGPAITGFNAFDRVTAVNTPHRIYAQATGDGDWGALTVMQENSNTTTPWSVGIYAQSTNTNASGEMDNVIGIFGEADSFATGTGTVAHLAGVQGLTENHSGTTTIQTGFTTYLDVDATATSTNVIHFYGQPLANDGTVTNYYGLYLPNITGGATLNKSIFTQGGWHDFNDVASFTIGGSAALPNNVLEVKGSGTGYVSLGQVSGATSFGCVAFTHTACGLTNYSMASDGTNTRVNAPTGSSVIFAINNGAIGTVSSAGFELNDGATDSPKLAWTPQTGTAFTSYVEDTGDDLQIEANTGSTETVDFVNIGAGVMDVTVDGTMAAGTLTEGGTAVPNTSDNITVFASLTTAMLAGELSDEDYEPGDSAALGAATATFTNKTLNVESAGNDVTLTQEIVIVAAGCDNATAAKGLDTPTANAPTASCFGTAPTRFAYLDFPDGSSTTANGHFRLPTGWTGTVDLDLYWACSLATCSTNNVSWNIYTVCIANAESMLDPTYNALQEIVDAGIATLHQRNQATQASVTTTGCAAGETLFFKINRDAGDASDTFAGTAGLLEMVWTLRRTI